MKEFLKRKNIEISFERYLIDAMSAMAMGLFATLIIGVILGAVGSQANIPFLVEPLGATAKLMGGVGIAVAVAISLRAPNLVIYAAIVNGYLAYTVFSGGPVGAFVAAVIGVEFGKLVSGETSIDVVLTPAVAIITGSVVGYFIGGPIDTFMIGVGKMINQATDLQPLPMGIIVSVVMAILLVLPTSSTAIVVMIYPAGLASGATAVGCCAVCVAFAVASYRENGMKGIWAQIPGSPMIQVGNIFRKPIVLLPAIIAAVIVGGLSTTLIPVSSISEMSGTGTSGFVTPIGMYVDMVENGQGALTVIGKIALLGFILPALIALAVSESMRKIGWLKDGDLKLNI